MITSLPNELISYIFFEYLWGTSAFNFALTCKRVHSIFSTNHHKIYRKYLRKVHSNENEYIIYEDPSKLTNYDEHFIPINQKVMVIPDMWNNWVGMSGEFINGQFTGFQYLSYSFEDYRRIFHYYTMCRRVPFTNSKRNGVGIEYLINNEINKDFINVNKSKITKIVNFDNDKLIGKVIEYYILAHSPKDENKSLPIEKEYTLANENTLHGQYKQYHKNGKLMVFSNFSSGKLDGLVQVWDIRGELQVEMEYSSGILVYYKRITRTR
jgi:antitoxin component YwqK of YwqJK toxin-antitoxin module